MTKAISSGTTGILEKFPVLYEVGNIVKCERKGIIFHEGEPWNHIYILLSGLLMAYRTLENGQLRILDFFMPNKTFGHITLNNSHPITVEALEASTYLRINKDTLKSLIDINPAILWSLYEDVEKKLIHMSQIVLHSSLSTDAKIVRSILFMCKEYGYRVDDGIEIRIAITHEELAHFTGTTRATISRFLSHLAKENIMRTKPKPWVIYQVNRLISYME